MPFCPKTKTFYKKKKKKKKKLPGFGNPFSREYKINIKKTLPEGQSTQLFLEYFFVGLHYPFTFQERNVNENFYSAKDTTSI